MPTIWVPNQEELRRWIAREVVREVKCVMRSHKLAALTPVPKLDSSTPLGSLPLSVRAINALCVNNGILTIGELCDRTETDLLKIRNLGRQTLREIQLFLALNGLKLRNSTFPDDE